MKFIRVLASALNDQFLNMSNWTVQPIFSKEGKIYKLTGRYRADLISRIPGNSNEQRLWTEDYSELGNWSKETTKKYKELAEKEGIKSAIMILLYNNKITCWEGNHRKELAKYLKLKDVPVIVFCWTNHLPTKDYFGMLTKIEENKYVISR